MRLIIVFESLYRELRRVQHELALVSGEPPELVELGITRTEGVKIRNDWSRLSDPDNLPDFQSIYEGWNERMLIALGKLSPADAAWLTTLNKWYWRYPKKLSQEHGRYLNIIDEKLSRLDLIIQRYLGLD